MHPRQQEDRSRKCPFAIKNVVPLTMSRVNFAKRRAIYAVNFVTGSALRGSCHDCIEMTTREIDLRSATPAKVKKHRQRRTTSRKKRTPTLICVPRSVKKAILAHRTPFNPAFCADQTGRDRVFDDFGGRHDPLSKQAVSRYCIFCARRQPKNMSNKEWEQHSLADHTIPCNLCHCTFLSDHDRATHIRHVHIPAEYCPTCHLKRSRNHDAWLKHVSKAHPVPCSRCKLFFTKTSHMELHFRAVHKARPSNTSRLEWLPADVFILQTSTPTVDTEIADLERILSACPATVEGDPLVRQHTEMIVNIFENLRARAVDLLHAKESFATDRMWMNSIEVTNCRLLFELVTEGSRLKDTIKVRKRKQKAGSVPGVEVHALVSDPLTVIAQTSRDVSASFLPGGTRHGKIVIKALSGGRWYQLLILMHWVRKAAIMLIEKDICILSILVEAIRMDTELMPTCDGQIMRESHDLTWSGNHIAEEQTLRLVFHSNPYAKVMVSQIIQNIERWEIDCTFSAISHELLYIPEYFRLLGCRSVQIDESETLVFIGLTAGVCVICNVVTREITERSIDALPPEIIRTYVQYNLEWQSCSELDLDVLLRSLERPSVPEYIPEEESALQPSNRKYSGIYNNS